MHPMVRPFALAATAVLLVGAGARPAGERDPLSDWKADLAYRTDGWWLTSNDAYRDEDRGIEAYGMRLRAAPGGLAATGCLWGVRGGDVLGPFWHFSTGWDAERGAAFAYQTSPGGAAAFGYHAQLGADLSRTDQVMVWPDGRRDTGRHESRFARPDTLHDGSLLLVDGTWEPRRRYTWVRHSGEDTPC